MVTTFLLPVRTALLVYPIIVLVVLLPAAFVSYRRRGRAGGWASVVFYSFLFYLLACVLETVMPLPANASYCARHTYASSPQLRPFYFVQVIEEHAHRNWSLPAILHNGALWSSALNVVMLLPLGVYLRYWRGMRLAPTILIGFGTSLFFELTQLTGLWFVYPCPYRLFSVDDMILNTTGAVVGWIVAGPLGRLLPTLEPDRGHRRYAKKVTFSRRLLALLADLTGFAVLLGFGAGLLTLFGQTRQHRGLEVLILALVWLALDVGHWDLGHDPRQLLIPVGMVLALVVVGMWTPLAVLLDERHQAPYERLSRTVNAAIVRKPQTITQRVRRGPSARLSAIGLARFTRKQR